MSHYENIQENNRTFRIGELAKLSGVSSDSIRYYEEVGLLHPRRNPDNHYREYTAEDLMHLVLIREMLELNFSTNQIREWMKDRTVQSTQKLLAEEIQAIDEQIRDLFDKRANLQTRQELLGQNILEDCVEKIKIRKFAQRPCLKVHDGRLEDDIPARYLLDFIITNKVKLSTLGACDCYTIEASSLCGDARKDRENYTILNTFFWMDSLAETSNYALPAGRYLCLSYRGKFQRMFQFFGPMFDFIRENDFEMSGNPILLRRIDFFETSHDEEYLTEIQIPIEKKI